MKRYLFSCFLILITTTSFAQNFNDFFINKSLRLDYIFTGDVNHQKIVLDELYELPQWAGRRHHLNKLPLEGNGQIIVRDRESDKVIYKTSFSSLFQEWLTTSEAKNISKGFQNSFLIPYPKKDIEVEIFLFDKERNHTAKLKHVVKPSDILIHKKGYKNITPHKFITQNGDLDKTIDVAIVAEGYTKDEMELFYKDAERAAESLFFYEPFKSMKEKFNIVAVAAPSNESGVSVPRDEDWRETAVNSHFDTFYSDRYLTTKEVKKIHNVLCGIPYEHIIIIANTDVYGGGGIYNSYTLTTGHHPMFKPVVVHEFGHSFGGLADEYFYETDVMNELYPKNIEPWERNITTLVDFDSKWKEMIPKGTPMPTPIDKRNEYKIGLYEGAGYSAKGIYRAAYDCRMRTNECDHFCPICQKALRDMIDFYTK